MKLSKKIKQKILQSKKKTFKKIRIKSDMKKIIRVKLQKNYKL
jgi:hypothetical protein